MTANKFLYMLLTLAILLDVFTIPVMAEENIKVVLNGRELTFDVPPQLINNRTMVPMRKIFEALGAEVEWYGESQVVQAIKDDTVIEIKIDSEIMIKNEQAVILDVPAQVINNRALIPVHAVAEALDAEVKWDGRTKTVIITKEEKPVAIKTVEKGKGLSDEVFSLIDNRLFVAMPEGTIDSAIQFSVMSAPASNHRETRLMFEENEEKLVLYAYEVFAYSSGNIENDAKLLTDSWGEGSDISYSYSKIENENIQAMRIIPSSFDSKNGAILLRSSLVKTIDNMLVVINIYANPEKFKNEDNCFKLADEILGTLEAGTRIIDTSAHKETIWLHEIEIQKDYVITLDRGPDFDVYYITKIVGLSKNRSGMGIYIGGHPSEAKAPEDVEVKKISDKIAGKTIEWISYKQNDILRMETVVDIPSNDYLMMHIFISAYAEKELEELLIIAQSLKSNE